MNSFCFPFGLRIFFVGLAQFFVRAVGGKVSNFSTDLGKTAAAFFFWLAWSSKRLLGAIEANEGGNIINGLGSCYCYNFFFLTTALLMCRLKAGCPIALGL